MGPKPIQDVAPPPRATGSPVEPPSGPEMVGDIPVRAPTGYAANEQKPTAKADDDSNFIVPATSRPAAVDKEKKEPKIKDGKPKPVLAIAVALLAIILLAAGVYLKYFSNR